MTIDFEIHQMAEELFVLEGLPLEAVAKKAGVSKRTVEIWSVDEGWVEKRKEYRRALGEIKRNTVLAKLEFIKGAMETLDPQKAYAFSSIMSATKAVNESREVNPPSPSRKAPNRKIRTHQEAIEALEEAVSAKLNFMLSNPEAVNLKAVKDLKDAMILIDELKTRYRGKEDREKGLSDETVKEFREKLLGIRK